jgi:hypothetical protein
MPRNLISPAFFLALVCWLSAPVAAQQPPDWAMEAQAYLQQYPANTGLRHYLDAYNAYDTSAFPKSDMESVIKGGWSQSTPAVVQALKANARALDLASQAARVENTKLPPIDMQATALPPVPNVLKMQGIPKLMLCKARYHEASGDYAQAMNAAIDAARLSSFFCGENQPLINHLLGLEGIKDSIPVIQSLIKQQALDQSIIQSTGSRLYQIENSLGGPGKAIRSEGVSLMITLRHLASTQGSADLQSTLSAMSPEQAEQFKAFLAMDENAIKAAIDKFYGAIEANLSRPPYERDTMDTKWLSQYADTPILLVSGMNTDEVAVRYATTITTLRLCQVLCAVRLGKTDVAANIIDPYSGKSFQRSGNKLYGIGPDMKDQKAMTEYDPTNGTISAGDISVQP